MKEVFPDFLSFRDVFFHILLCALGVQVLLIFPPVVFLGGGGCYFYFSSSSRFEVHTMMEEKLPDRGWGEAATDNYRNHVREKITSSRNPTSYLGGETIREQCKTVYNQALNCAVRIMSAIGIQRKGAWDYRTIHSILCRQTIPLPGRDVCLFFESWLWCS